MAVRFKFFLFLFTLFIIKNVSALYCYRCSASSRNADKADKACVYGYSTLPKQKCPGDHVCSTYQYEISIQGLIKSSVTIRGCQPDDLLEDCSNLLDEIRELLQPARIKQLNCYSCISDLCNSDSKV